jgi:hypothetical protein
MFKILESPRPMQHPSAFVFNYAYAQVKPVGICTHARHQMSRFQLWIVDDAG